MNRDDLPDEDRAFLDALARKIWQARREGALVGCLYTLCVVGMLYVALFEYGPTHPVSALCYGGGGGCAGVGIQAFWVDAWITRPRKRIQESDFPTPRSPRQSTAPWCVSHSPNASVRRNEQRNRRTQADNPHRVWPWNRPARRPMLMRDRTKGLSAPRRRGRT